jgi:hypothetical protein
MLQVSTKYHKHLSLLALLSMVVLLVFSSCRKERTDYDTSALLSFSTDTITFDTVFTTIGSSTSYFMIYNNADKPLLISRVYLANGAASNFRINVDGVTGLELSNIEIGAQDSLFAFVEVTVDPNGGSTPMLITDSMVFETNGNIQDIDLIAYGQDAYFIVADRHIEGLPPFKIVAEVGEDTIWTATKPIVIYGYAVIDSAASLTIEEGTEIYLHNSSGLWAYTGSTLKINGSLNNPVRFQGDRLESAYEDVPGQWDRIWLNESPNTHQINYAHIKNGFIGLQTEPINNNGWNCNVDISNTIIENMSGAGILSRTAIINGFNVLIYECQQYAAALTMGGAYSFLHSTFANYWSYSIRNTPGVYVNNYFKDGNNVVYPFDLLAAEFVNCIIDGNVANELLLDSVSGAAFSYRVSHSMVKTEMTINAGPQWNAVLLNQDPQFVDYQERDYHVLNTSPAIGYGQATSLTLDLEGNPRSASAPTLGVYENPGSN